MLGTGTSHRGPHAPGPRQPVSPRPAERSPHWSGAPTAGLWRQRETTPGRSRGPMCCVWVAGVGPASGAVGLAGEGNYGGFGTFQSEPVLPRVRRCPGLGGWGRIGPRSCPVAGAGLCAQGQVAGDLDASALQTSGPRAACLLVPMTPPPSQAALPASAAQDWAQSLGGVTSQLPWHPAGGSRGGAWSPSALGGGASLVPMSTCWSTRARLACGPPSCRASP